MKRVVGCAVFVGLLAVAGIVLLKRVGRQGMMEPTFKENTARGACERFVKAMAEGDLTTMQEFAHPDLKDECEAFIDRFPTSVRGDIKGCQASFVKEGRRDRVRVTVYTTATSRDVILWVKTVDDQPLVTACQF